MNTNQIHQMELGLDARSRRLARQARSRRGRRAQWWFAQMRRVVGTAMEWSPESPARPAQVYMALAGRRP